jgi:hypothetical protein
VQLADLEPISEVTGGDEEPPHLVEFAQPHQRGAPGQMAQQLPGPTVPRVHV